MAITTHTVEMGITLPINGELTFSLGPRTVIVQDHDEGEDTVLEWVIRDGEGEFDSQTPFTWNVVGATEPSPPAVALVEGTVNVLRSAPYRNTAAAPVTWAYTVRLHLGVNTISADPEVDNEPPI